MKIGLLDHMGYGNLGDAATQDVMIASLRKRLPDAQLVGFSIIPGDTMKRHGIPCYPILRWIPTLGKVTDQPVGGADFKSRLKSALKSNRIVYSCAKPVIELAREAMFWVRSYRILRTLDILVISGGGQLGELWHGPWLQPYTLLKFSLLTKLARKKLYFVNVGAGPLEHPLSRLFARWAVQIADYRSFRDEDSRELVHSLGVKAKTDVYPDLVYGLEVGAHTNSRPRGTSMPIVGLNPTGFCDSRIWPRKDDALYEKYLEKLTRFSASLIQQGYILRLFSTDITVDHYALEDLEVRLRPKVSSSELRYQVCWAASESVKDVLREMSEFDFVVTSKYHGIVFSHVLRKPVISLSYHRKMDFAMRAVGQAHFSADIERFDLNWLISTFRALVDEGASLRSGSATAVDAYAAALSQQFDSLFQPDKLQLGANSPLSSVRRVLIDQVRR